MDETAKKGAKLPLNPPSLALKGYVYDTKQKSWVWRKGEALEPTLPEFPLPDVDDESSLQAWLSSDWLKAQEN